MRIRRTLVIIAAIAAFVASAIAIPAAFQGFAPVVVADGGVHDL
jgi:hypothetical protein